MDCCLPSTSGIDADKRTAPNLAATSDMRAMLDVHLVLPSPTPMAMTNRRASALATRSIGITRPGGYRALVPAAIGGGAGIRLSLVRAESGPRLQLH
jgi:hypothetical protein